MRRASSTVSNDSTASTAGPVVGAAGDAQHAAGRRRLLTALGLLAAGVLVVDQVTKILAVSRLAPGEYLPLLGDLFGLMLVFNPGAAFSLASGSTWIFTIVAVVVAVVIVRVSRRIGSRGWAVALGALLGGNLGNLGDRLFREPGFGVGHVVDFLNYGGLFVGNVADIAIVLAAVGMAILAFLGIGIDGTRHAAAAKADEGDEAARAEADDEVVGSDGADTDVADGDTTDVDGDTTDADADADADEAGRGPDMPRPPASS